MRNKSTILTWGSLYLILVLLISCTKENQDNGPKNGIKKYGFEYLESSHSNINFNNVLDHTKVRSVVDYINVFNGGGVSTGDINNDGLVDIYFTGNISDNALYLNKGDLKFEDITQSAGLEVKDSWSTGTSMIDINQDGLLDIYVCRSYIENDPTKRENLMYINQGEGKFREMGRQMGLNDNGYSIQAAFFDFDNDGDLDVYVANHPRHLTEMPGRPLHQDLWEKPVFSSSDHLYINEGGVFQDITIKSGVLNYGWTLGVSAADFNNDGYTDLYISTDHELPDYYYVNQGDGTFKNEIQEAIKHTAFSSMGSDVTDLNNDGWLDLINVDMLSQDNFREKSQMGNMDVDGYWQRVEKGYHHQMMRNVIQLNSGKGTFQEIGQLANFSKTDWSWSPLGVDLNNDMNQDIFVTNGYLLDIMDKDNRKILDNKMAEAHLTGNLKEMGKIARQFQSALSSTPLANYFFENRGNLVFEEKSSEYNLDFLGFSTGASYADLDNDGDVDLICNNHNQKATVHINQANDGSNTNNYLRVRLDNEKNTSFGTKVLLHINDEIITQELTSTRGYQSSVEPVLHFGLGGHKQVKKLEVIWPGNKVQRIDNVKANQTLTIKKDQNIIDKVLQEKPFLEELVGVEIMHVENTFDDYAVQVLLPHKMSQFGPALTTGDIDGDGSEEIFFGGASGTTARIFKVKGEREFIEMPNPIFFQHKDHEDVDAILEDLDGDNDLDLYVVSGGNEFIEGDKRYQDRIYLNDGKGNFSFEERRISDSATSSGSCVAQVDFDKDGDFDLFVGSRHTPGKYPIPPKSKLLINQDGVFSEVNISKEFDALGMVTDAVWHDLDGNGFDDLIVVGEWMNISVFTNIDGELTNKTELFGLAETRGWWNAIAKEDLNGDGKMDFIVGNLGNNYKYKVGNGHEFHVYADDFDQNGSADIALGYKNQNKIYPVRGRQCSSEQCPSVKDKFESYKDFAIADISQVYRDIEKALHYEINTFSSCALISNQEGKFQKVDLPNLAQLAPINDIYFADLDNDKQKEIIMAGNLYVSEIETGRADAGIGNVLQYKEDKITCLPATKSGFFADMDVRKIRGLKLKGQAEWILVANNDGPLQIFKPST